MVTHDQEEALGLADRIVIMNRGRIEQVGTPTEVYAHPASPFVADFVGRMNFLTGGWLVAENQVLIAGARLACLPFERNNGRGVTLAMRPEDVVVRGVNDGAPNLISAHVQTLDFAGNHFSASLQATDSDLKIAADFSMNAVRDLGLARGQVIRVSLPPERLHVFARAM